MIKYVLPSLAVLLVSAFAPIARSQVILPYSIGSANGYQEVVGFRDAQPATEPTQGTTTANFGTNGTFYADPGRAFYIDFGANFSSITIDRVYVGLKQYGDDPIGVNVTYHWSNSSTYVPANGPSGNPAPNFNLLNFTAATQDKSWQQIYSGPPVTPEARYYIGVFNGATTMTNRIQEIVFVSAIPEPTSALLGMIGLGALAFRRRR